jgi:hypothetical protein
MGQQRAVLNNGKVSWYISFGGLALSIASDNGTEFAMYK